MDQLLNGMNFHAWNCTNSKSTRCHTLYFCDNTWKKSQQAPVTLVALWKTISLQHDWLAAFLVTPNGDPPPKSICPQMTDHELKLPPTHLLSLRPGYERLWPRLIDAPWIGLFGRLDCQIHGSTLPCAIDNIYIYIFKENNKKKNVICAARFMESAVLSVTSQ